MNRHGRGCKQRKGRRTEQGFSLIELLVVVLVILILSAVAIPNLFRSRIAANESSAVSSVRQIVTAEALYSASWGSWLRIHFGQSGGTVSRMRRREPPQPTLVSLTTC